MKYGIYISLIHSIQQISALRPRYSRIFSLNTKYFKVFRSIKGFLNECSIKKTIILMDISNFNDFCTLF